MDISELLVKAIQAAHSGRELGARDLFQDVVRLDPNNEIAWMWLSGLLDSLDDRIIACKKVLSINPGNQKVRVYLESLIKEQQTSSSIVASKLDDQIQLVHQFVENGENDEALIRLREILQNNKDHKDAWLLFADLSVSIQDKARAYQAVVKIDPSNGDFKKELKRYRYYQKHPLELGAFYEEEGKMEKAIDLYRALIAEADNSSDFERAYKNLTRLEKNKVEKIRYVHPSLHILRLSAGLPIMYFLEVIMQAGFKPMKNPAPDLWLGFLFVIFGSFLIALASVSSRHVIWQKFFGEKGSRGSVAARSIVMIVGWMMIIAPHMLLVWDSVMRLRVFDPPPFPWTS